MAQNMKVLKGRGHASRSSIKVNEVLSTMRLLLLSKHKKFGDVGIARLCSIIDKSQRRKPGPGTWTKGFPCLIPKWEKKEGKFHCSKDLDLSQIWVLCAGYLHEIIN